MATLTLSLTVGANTYTKTVTIANADALRLQAAYEIIYADSLPADPTVDQMFQVLAQDIFNNIKRNVINQETVSQQPVIPDIPLT